MTEMSKEELNIEEFKIKEEIVSFKEEILPSSIVDIRWKHFETSIFLVFHSFFLIFHSLSILQSHLG